ncbi:MAG: hypothetical protein AAFX06_14855 [Planctomycetota bacterium]
MSSIHSLEFLQELNLAEIATLDGGELYIETNPDTGEPVARIRLGRIGEALQMAFKRIAEDLDDRGADERARTVTLKMVFKPDNDEETGHMEGVDFGFTISDSIPARSSRTYDATVRRTAKGKSLVFSRGNNENHRQPALPGAE